MSSLFECFEDRADTLRRDADAGVRYREPHMRRLFGLLGDGKCDRDPPFFRELDCVSYEVEEDLPEPGWISHDHFGQIRRPVRTRG